MTIFEQLIIQLGWRLNLIHVPEWDNIQAPWIRPDKTPMTRQAAAPRPDTITMDYGRAEPGEVQKKVEMIETKSEDLSWDYTRYDGKNGAPNYSAWSIFDDQVLNDRKFSDKQRENYNLVRMDVIEGMTNAAAAAKHGRKIRWAETYCGAVREMCRIRRIAENIEV